MFPYSLFVNPRAHPREEEGAAGLQETWLDGQPSELSFEWLESLIAVACFLPGRAKDLSAPRYVIYLSAEIK